MRTVGVDVGGTFTDIVLVKEDGSYVVHKVPSTPGAQERAVIQGISEVLETHSVDAKEVALVVHGTTVAANAMIERRGAHVCLLTTEGFEDILEIGRQDRSEIYDLTATRPAPLVAADDRIGVHERTGASGEVVVPLKQEEVQRVVRLVGQRRPEGVAISLLFSFREPRHERVLLEALRRELDAYVVASSEVLPEFREFERTSTTVLEAYLGPLVVGYVSRLAEMLASTCPRATLTLMQSNGGTMHADRVHGHAVGLAVSGLAGGVIGGLEIARQHGLDSVITLDMGGTSCDVAAVHGRVPIIHNNTIGGLPIRFPTVDVRTIGAGGGSIAWVDDMDILHVGPQSAGASPGPAAYGRGGTDATVTDANVLLGRINPDYFLGGRMQLERDLAETAVRRIAEKLDMGVEDTALGIVRISTANMVEAIRGVTVGRGQDPRAFTLVAFGGAGPTQAVDIAQALHIASVLVPRHPGTTSALGLVCAETRVDLVQTVLVDDPGEVRVTVGEVLQDLTTRAVRRVERQTGDSSGIRVEWSVDMRYVGQSHELTVPVPRDEHALAEVSRERVETEHERRFGYRLADRGVEWVTARVVATQDSRRRVHYRQPGGQGEGPVGEREVLTQSGWCTATVYRRDGLRSAQRVDGPAVIEQPDTTVYVGPGWYGTVTAHGALWLRRSDT